jgi:hypothetical protein
LSAYKEAASIVDESGDLPAFLVFGYGSCFEALEILVDAYPEVLSREVNARVNILSEAVGNYYWDFSKLIFQRNPELARIPDSIGKLPLHAVVATSGDLESARNIYEAYPEAIRTFTNYGWLPLHYAFADRSIFEATSADSDLVRFLLRQYPDAANMQLPEETVGAVAVVGDQWRSSNDRRPMLFTPYQLSVRNRSCEYIQRILLRACPAADPQRLREMNYKERRQLMFLAFAACVDTRVLKTGTTIATAAAGAVAGSTSRNEEERKGYDDKEAKDKPAYGAAGVGDGATFVHRLRRLMNIGEEMGLLKHIASFL